MFRYRKNPLLWLALAFGATLGCNSSNQQAAQQNKIIGAGSTFINPIMTHWISEFQSSHPDVQINYQSIGSGGGTKSARACR